MGLTMDSQHPSLKPLTSMTTRLLYLVEGLREAVAHRDDYKNPPDNLEIQLTNL